MSEARTTKYRSGVSHEVVYNDNMYKLEIDLPDDAAEQLEQIAPKRNLSLEEFAANSLAEALGRHADFQNAGERVLSKNTELYKQLA